MSEVDKFSGFDPSSWEDEESTKQSKVIEEGWEDDAELETSHGLNIAFTSEEFKGKSLLATLSGYLNTEYFDKMNVKEEFPKTYQMIKSGLIPEVEQFMVLDLDNSYRKLSKLGIFGKLVKPLYNAHKIKRKTIKIPKRQIKIYNTVAKEAAKLDIQNTKLRIENNITACIRDNGPEVALFIDSMSSYDELLNDWFRIIYEDVLVKLGKENLSDSSLGTSLKGIRQSYYQIRNGWWVETLRDKRTYEGWNIDSYKVEEKPYVWLELERKNAPKVGKKPEDIDLYKIQWAPKTEYDLDLVFRLNNGIVIDEQGIEEHRYWADLKSRFEGSKPIKMQRRCFYTPFKRYAFYEILEEVAPYLLGEVKGKDGKFKIITEEEMW